MNRLIKNTLLAAITVITVSSCSGQQDTLVTYLPDAGEASLVAEHFQAIEQQSNISLKAATGVASTSRPIDLIANREIDLTVIANSAPFNNQVKTILPLYRGVLHMFIRESLSEQSNGNFLEGKSVFIDDSTGAVQEFIDYFVSYRGLDLSKVTMVDDYKPGETDVLFVFAPVLKDWQSLTGYKIVSFGDAQRLGTGTPAEAISYLLPKLKPFIIPAQTYLGLKGNQEAVLTVSVDMLLVTHDQTDSRTIYNLSEALMDNRSMLSVNLPSIFYSLSDQFNPLDLTFTLHPGARAYIERNEPTFIERYAETINTLVYIAVLIFTAVVALMRWNNQKQKNRIDVLYSRLFEIRDQLITSGSEHPADTIRALYDIEREAFALLIDEKVASDESFTIFLTLLHETVELAQDKAATHGR